MLGQQGFIKYCFCCLVQDLSLLQQQKCGSSAKNGNPESKSDHHHSICHSFCGGNMDRLGDYSRKLNTVLSITRESDLQYVQQITFQRVQSKALYRKIHLEKYYTIHPRKFAQ